METNKALVELSENLRSLSKQAWKTGEYLFTPQDVRYYLGFTHSYSRASAEDLLYKFGCPRPRRFIGGPWTPISKTLVDLFIAARRRRRRCYRGTRLQRESLRLVEEKGLTIAAAASLLNVSRVTVSRAAKAMRAKKKRDG
jgi:hypothetical protein